MTDSMTYPLTTSHISVTIPSVFKPFHNNMVRSTGERFAMERMATTTKRWLRRLRSDGDTASCNIGRPCGAEAGVCLVSRVILAVSLAAFFSLFWLFGVVCNARFAPCSCCCSHVHVSSPTETMCWQADANCSRSAAPRRRLVGRVLLPAARAARPSEHEDLLGSAISRNQFHLVTPRDLAVAQHFKDRCA